jgi:hypothetical protein
MDATAIAAIRSVRMHYSHPIPEPSTTLLPGDGLLALSFLVRRHGRI